MIGVTTGTRASSAVRPAAGVQRPATATGVTIGAWTTRAARLLLSLAPLAPACVPAAAEPAPGAEVFVDASAAAGIDAPHGGAWEFDGKGGFLRLRQ